MVIMPAHWGSKARKLSRIGFHGLRHASEKEELIQHWLRMIDLHHDDLDRDDQYRDVVIKEDLFERQTITFDEVDDMWERYEMWTMRSGITGVFK
jgi:hypothetical protein